MSGPRYARRTDSNHAEIRELFKRCGCQVVDTSNLGGKVGDLIVQHFDHNGRRITHIVEIKDGDKPPSRKKFTNCQNGNILHLERIESRSDVFDLLGIKDWEMS